MEEEKNEVEETIEDEELPDIEETDETDWKAEAEKARGIAQRAKTKLDKLKKEQKEQAKEVVPAKKESNADILDDNALDFLDLKGVSDTDEIDVIRKVISKTGQTVREALKDEYVVAKLESLRAEKAVLAATPSSTKRGAGGTDNLAAAVAKFQKTNELPSDFELRQKVVEALVASSGSNKPSWH